MGLDMYLEGRTFNWTMSEAKLDMRDGYRVKGVTLDLGYWRKHPNLHGYIVQTFCKGEDDQRVVNLNGDDLLKLIAAVENEQLPRTEGFFFGQSDGSEKARDLKILRGALAWLQGSTPPASRDFEPLPGGGAILEIKPEDFADAKETREVVYFASW